MSKQATRPEASGDLVQMAAFRVGDQQYVIDIMRVREIINPLPITAVPSAVAQIEGVVNLRGVIIPIVDLRKRLSLPEEKRSTRPKIIIVLVESQIVGVVVDEVLEVVRLPRGLIKPAPRLLIRQERDLVLGVCEFQGRLLLLLNLKQVLRPALAERQPVAADSGYPVAADGDEPP